MSDQENMEFLVVLLFATCIYLWLKGKSHKSSLHRIKSQSPIDSESLKTDSALTCDECGERFGHAWGGIGMAQHKWEKHGISGKASFNGKVVEFGPGPNSQLPEEGVRSLEVEVNRPNPDHIRVPSSSALSLGTGFSELDGPGMFQRVNRYGPQGEVLYLVYSSAHQAYKVGISRPHKLGDRLRMIRVSVPDARIDGTAVFTSRQNAYEREQKILEENKDYKYNGIKGDQAGRSEWISRRPTGTRFTSPKKVEEVFLQDASAPAQELDIQDRYTVYMVYSRSKSAYLLKYCRSDRLSTKLKAIKEAVPDAELVSRFKVDRSTKAREIAVKLNIESGSYISSGRRDQYEWSEDPKYVEKLSQWGPDGTRLS